MRKRVLGLMISVAVLLAVGAWLLWMVWMFKAAEPYAKCDDGFAVWRRDPGAWSSYKYETRDGAVPLESGLQLQSEQLRDFMREHNCVVQIHG